VHELTPPAIRWLTDHHGVITTAVLRRCGVGRPTIRRVVRSGILQPVHKGVFVVATAAATLEQRCAALSAAHPSGFVTGPTAGVLLDLRRMPRTSSIHYAVRHGIHLTEHPGVHFRQTTALPPSHRTVRRDGICIATFRRLAFDLAADLKTLDHLSLLHQLLDEHRVSFDELVSIGRHLGHPARDGSVKFRRALELLGGGATAAQSHPEVALATALRERAVPVEGQTQVVRHAGRLAHIDLAVPDIKWGIELDIHPEHRSLEGHANDARRYRDLHLGDWQIEPVSEQDLADVEGLADELTALYHRRRRRFLTHSSATGQTGHHVALG
jgi:Transcriptional regulator, AbiEi antitoxin